MSRGRSGFVRWFFGVPIMLKVAGAFVMVTVLGTTVAGALIDRAVAVATKTSFEDRLGAEATMLGQMTANALFGDLDPNDTSLTQPVRSLGEAVYTGLTVIAKDGTVVATSRGDDVRALGSQIAAVEIVAAAGAGAGVAVRDGRLFVARRIVRDGATLGFARASVPMAEVTLEVQAVRQQVAVGAAIATLFAILLGLLFAHRLVRPIRALSLGARRVGEGDFGHVIDVENEDEIGELATRFSEMTRSLQRTISTLDQRNADMRLVLDNVSQGLCTISPDGAIGSERSAILDRWLTDAAPGKHLWEAVSEFDPTTAFALEMHWRELRIGALPQEVLVTQLPSRLTQGDRVMELEYTPILEEDGETLRKMLLVVTDVSAKVAAERASAEQRELANVFEHILRDRAGVTSFLADANAHIAVLAAEARADLVEIRRRLHTLKGNSAVFGVLTIATLCHEIESRMLADGGDMPAPDRRQLKAQWERFSTNVTSFLGESQAGIVIHDEEYRAVWRALTQRAPRSELTKLVAGWKHERVNGRLGHLAEVARRTAHALDKSVDVIVEPTTLRGPREDWTGFWSSLVHAVRNAIDHGIEDPKARAKSGKPARGRVTLSATRTGDWLSVQIADDGGGIDFRKIRERAEARGLPHATRDELVAGLFADGISSRDEVSHVSGRGVGLGAAKAECERRGGFVSLVTEPGRGTTFEFHLPVPEVVSSDFSGLSASSPARASPG